MEPSTNESRSAESRSVLNVVKYNETNRYFRIKMFLTNLSNYKKISLVNKYFKVNINENYRQNRKEQNLIGREKDKDMNSISGQESNIKYLEIYENLNKTSRPQGRTLSTIAGE